MIELYNAETDQLVGTINETDLQALADALEEESADDREATRRVREIIGRTRVRGADRSPALGAWHERGRRDPVAATRVSDCVRDPAVIPRIVARGAGD